MKKKIRMTVEFDVTERGASQYGSAEELRRALNDYMQSDESPLHADYGPEAWGGYDGAFITRGLVIESKVVDA